MTIDRVDLADSLDLLARLCRAPEPEGAPPDASPGFDAQAYKAGLLAVSQGGVRLLQRALGGIGIDGAVGPETRAALAAVDLGSLLKAINEPALPPPLPPNSKSGLTDELRAEYKSLFASAAIRPEHKAQVSALATRIRAAEILPSVVSVSAQTGVPARVICIMQALEANLDFSCHLHNGDPLTKRTANVPAGRPEEGTPPFSWEASALDALRFHGLNEWHDWSNEGAAYIFERYNGWGYRRYHPTVKSPYLWSFTTVYSVGKYDSDGHYDPNLVSKQCGAMAMLKELGGI